MRGFVLLEAEEEDQQGLETASEIIVKHALRRAELPKLLAGVALSGHRDEALQALIDWGTGRRAIDEIWEEMSPLAPGNGDRG